MAKQKNKTKILFRYGFITFCCVVLCVFIGVKLFFTTVVDAPEWNKEANRMLDTVVVIPPERGSILASNGSILACNMLVWDLKLDLRHPKIKDNPIPWPAIDSLADYLDAHHPRPANLASLPPDSMRYYSWHQRFRREFAKNKWSRSFIIAKGVDSEAFARLGALPFLRRFYGHSNSPYYRSSRYVRSQPYGSMAHYSIGVVNQDPTRNHEVHGYSGLEKDLDSLLYGKPGRAKRVTLTTGIGNWNELDPVRGYDVITTIDINIQDMLEQELFSRLEYARAEWGTAMIMEVATGEIKAISNLERLPDGSYGEAFNRIVNCYEPGSVLKAISLLIAFEDGLITSNSNTVDTSPFQKTTDPHAPTVKTIPEVMAWSSNTGVARIIFRGYADHPELFRKRWESLGLLERFHTGIAEEVPPRIPPILTRDRAGNRITQTARHLTLARQAFGYSLEISPLYTLSVYNAIANGGRFVRPHLVRALRFPGRPDSVLRHAPVREKICSPRTAAMLRECLLQVVKAGTARNARLDEVVEIAGKTGTCFPVFEKGKGKGYDKSRRRYAFAGFFPYSRPKYSCIVVIQAGAGAGGAAGLSGTVLKRVAERLYARGLLDNRSEYAAERVVSAPVMTPGNDRAMASAAAALGVSAPRRLAAASPSRYPASKVPDVAGYDIASAVALLERRGLDVTVRGCGRVARQSLPPGSPVRPGARIILDLTDN